MLRRFYTEPRGSASAKSRIYNVKNTGISDLSSSPTLYSPQRAELLTYQPPDPPHPCLASFLEVEKDIHAGTDAITHSCWELQRSGFHTANDN